jgi:hypothetical protein
MVADTARSFPIRASACNVRATAQNAPTGTVLANAAIVPAGTSGAIDVLATNTTDLIIDINGYFAP